jgi:hypothetical protein
MITAAPPPVISTERAQPKPKTKTAEIIKRLFGEAGKAVTRRADAPGPPKKSGRRRGGDDDKGSAAMVHKHMRRLYRKVARRTGDDGRDDRPTFDSDRWHWHQQSVTYIASNHAHERALRPGPNYPSPTL